MPEIVKCSGTLETYELVTRLGNDIMLNGGEIFRANEAMSKAAKVYNLNSFSAYVIANGIFSTAIIDGEQYSTRICYVPLSPTVLCRVEALNDLSRRISDGNVSLTQLREELERIETMDTTGNELKIMASGLGSFGFCYIFGGSILDSGAAFCAGLIVYYVLLYLSPKFSSSKILQNTLAATAVSISCCIMVANGFGENLEQVMIGAIFPLVPGVPLTNSFRNFLENDYLSGLIRLVDALFVAGSIGMGVGIGMKLFTMFGGIL